MNDRILPAAADCAGGTIAPAQPLRRQGWRPWLRALQAPLLAATLTAISGPALAVDYPLDSTADTAPKVSDCAQFNFTARRNRQQDQSQHRASSAPPGAGVRGESREQPTR